MPLGANETETFNKIVQAVRSGFSLQQEVSITLKYMDHEEDECILVEHTLRDCLSLADGGLVRLTMTASANAPVPAPEPELQSDITPSWKHWVGKGKGKGKGKWKGMFLANRLRMMSNETGCGAEEDLVKQLRQCSMSSADGVASRSCGGKRPHQAQDVPETMDAEGECTGKGKCRGQRWAKWLRMMAMDKGLDDSSRDTSCRMVQGDNEAPNEPDADFYFYLGKGKGKCKGKRLAKWHHMMARETGLSHGGDGVPRAKDGDDSGHLVNDESIGNCSSKWRHLAEGEMPMEALFFMKGKGKGKRKGMRLAKWLSMVATETSLASQGVNDDVGDGADKEDDRGRHDASENAELGYLPGKGHCKGKGKLKGKILDKWLHMMEGELIRRDSNSRIGENVDKL